MPSSPPPSPTTDLPPVVQLESVGLRYGRGPEVLRDISMSLPAGSFHFLTGSSGAGKSSLLSMLHLARRPTRGRQFLFGEDVAHASRSNLTLLRRRIGMVFQDFRLLDHLSALDNVALPLRVRGVRERDIHKHVPELLNWVGLSKHLKDPPPILSGGQKQRVAIARAVIGRPDLLLADEPTGNVDDAIALRLLRLFGELNRLGTTVLIATHNESLVSRVPHIPRLHIEHGQLTYIPGAEGPVPPLPVQDDYKDDEA